MIDIDGKRTNKQYVCADGLPAIATEKQGKMVEEEVRMRIMDLTAVIVSLHNILGLYSDGMHDLGAVWNHNGKIGEMFKDLENSDLLLNKFVMNFRRNLDVTPEKFDTYITDNTEGLTQIIEVLTHIDYSGRQQPVTHRLVCMSVEEMEEYDKYLIKHNKLEKFKEKRKAISYSEGHEHKDVFGMGGWNAQAVVMVNQKGEWRKFDSMKACAKGLNLCYPKVLKAFKEKAWYNKMMFIPEDEWEGDGGFKQKLESENLI